MPSSPMRWKSERRLLRAGARQAHGRQPLPICRRSFAHGGGGLVSPSQRACVALFCVGNRSLDTFALPLQHQSSAISPASYQHRACVGIASDDRDSLSSQINRREVRPHLCVPAQPSVTTLYHPPHPMLQPTKHRKCRPIALGDYRCCRHRGLAYRRTQAAQSSCSPST